MCKLGCEMHLKKTSEVLPNCKHESSLMQKCCLRYSSERAKSFILETFTFLKALHFHKNVKLQEAVSVAMCFFP